jgi:hypothetical protein
MGIPVRFEADDRALLQSALQPYSDWSAAPRDQGAAPLRIRLRLGADAQTAGHEAAIVLENSLLSIRGHAAEGEARSDTRQARCLVPTDLASDPGWLASALLDTIVLFLVTRSGRIPLHAAGLLLGESAILLAGPSGSGKSTLALAAHREGIPVLSEDTVYVQLEPGFRVWGFPRPIHLLPTEEGRLGQLSGTSTGAPRLRGGRWKIPVHAEQSWPNGPTAERALLFLLDRGDRVEIRPVSQDVAHERVLRQLEPGFDHFRQDLPRALELVTRAGAWSLTLSADPVEAIAAIRSQLNH